MTIAQVEVGMTTQVFGFTGFLQCVGTDTVSDKSASSPFYSGSGLPIGTGPGQSPTGGMDIRVLENFATAWKEKNISGHLANGTFNGSIYTYNGGLAAPNVDDAQNVPGVVYDTESGFEYNSGTPVPSPNPLAGLGTGAATNLGRPLFDASTNIQAAGVASQGTRIAVQVSTPLPNGALLFFPIVVPVPSV